MNEARSPDQIERDISDIRDRISDTLDAVQEKLSPGELLDQVLNFSKEEGGAMIEDCARAIRRNPLPSAMIGAGLAWLLYANNRPRPEPAPREILDEARDLVRDKTRAGVDYVKGNPWGATAVALGVGAIVGALLLPTRRDGARR